MAFECEPDHSKQCGNHRIAHDVGGTLEVSTNFCACVHDHWRRHCLMARAAR